MRFSLLSTAFLLLAPNFSVAHPQPVSDLSQRDVLVAILDQPASEAHDHWKRKGGGGGGGGKGGGGGSSSSAGKSGGSTSSSSSSSSSSGGRTSGSSNAGGATSKGSGANRGYSGGKYYGGGATVPYTAGGRSPRGLVALPLAAGAALLIFPGIWLYGAYAYNYNNPYSFYNRTARRNLTSTATPTKRSLVERFFDLEIRQDSNLGVNETKPVTCLCEMYSVCGCDDSGDTSFLDSVIGDGDFFKLDHTLVQVADVNNISTIVLNGTLPNGTTAPGGTDDESVSMGVGRSVTGYWVMIVIVGFTCFLL